MKIPVLIVSGFLGVGKTTFIKELLRDFDVREKILIIENDFGEVNFDSAVFANKGLAVEELSSGCICCSLQGDFKKSLQKVLRDMTVDYILIEPSGVGMLSDIKGACLSEELANLIELKQAVTIVDALRSPLYAKNFGSFFKDQIQHADKIYVSHGEERLSTYDKTLAIVREINDSVPIEEGIWAELPLWQDIFQAGGGLDEHGATGEKALSEQQHGSTCGCVAHEHDNSSERVAHEHSNRCGCTDEEHIYHGSSHSEGGGCEHGENCACEHGEGDGHVHGLECEHHHDAAHTFTTFSIELKEAKPRFFYERICQEIARDQACYLGDEREKFSPHSEQLGMESALGRFGHVVRMKGIVPVLTKEGTCAYYEIQYRIGHMDMKKAEFTSKTMTIIGDSLEEGLLRQLWEGKI